METNRAEVIAGLIDWLRRQSALSGAETTQAAPAVWRALGVIADFASLPDRHDGQQLLQTAGNFSAKCSLASRSCSIGSVRCSGCIPRARAAPLTLRSQSAKRLYRLAERSLGASESASLIFSNHGVATGVRDSGVGFPDRPRGRAAARYRLRARSVVALFNAATASAAACENSVS